MFSDLLYITAIAITMDQGGFLCTRPQLHLAYVPGRESLNLRAVMGDSVKPQVPSPAFSSRRYTSERLWGRLAYRSVPVGANGGCA